MKFTDKQMKMMTTVDDIRRDSHYQVPKQLFINEKYRELSVGAKMMYAILSDRVELSKKNKWHDENGFVYAFFDCVKLSDLMSVSTSTVNRYKKELERHNLLAHKRLGQGKPNRLYILKVETVAPVENSHFDNSRIANMTQQEVSKSLGSDTELNETEESEVHYATITDYRVLRFLKIFKEYFNHDHRKINNDVSLYSIDGVDIDIEDEDFDEVVLHFFDKYGTGDYMTDRAKCSVDNFSYHLIGYDKDSYRIES